MRLSFEVKRHLRRLLCALGLILAALLLFCILRAIYLQRYLVYDENGVHLDYGGINTTVTPEKTPETEEGDFVLRQEAVVGTVEGEDAPKANPLLRGVYVSAGQLVSDESRPGIPGALGSANTVMLDMKTATGKFLYHTALAGTEKAAADLDAIEALVGELTARQDLTVIARIPAFQDSAFALADFSHSLPIRGGALWIDWGGSYWLDPAGKDVADYLVSTARELKQLGFDEVVFENFSFPASPNIWYDRQVSGTDATLTAAQTVAQRLASYNIPVSFQSTDPAVEALSARVYLEAENGSGVIAEAKAREAYLAGDDSRLVFLTASRDTRFQPYSTLSPLE